MALEHAPGNQGDHGTRQTGMHRAIANVLAVGLILTACGGGGRAPTFAESDSAALMAAALTQLVTEDHTFGDGPPPFTEYLIEASTITNSVVASADNDTSDATRPLTEDERVAVESAIAAFGPVRWVTNPDEWRTDDLTPVIDGSAILGVGIPSVDGDGALVPVSLWCSGLCGTWLTYRLELIDGAWQVTGIEGPIAIS